MRKLAPFTLLLALAAHAQAMAPSKCVNQDFDFLSPTGVCTRPPLLSILPPGFGAYATGSLAGVTVTRASSKSCQGATNLVLLGNNTPCVEASGLLVEGASTNLALQSANIGGTNWTAVSGVIAVPTVALATADLTAPDGSSTASKLTYPASTAAGQYSLVYQNVGAIAAGGTISIYLRSLSSPQTFYLSTDGNPAFIACAVTSTWRRFSLTVPTGGSQYIMLGTDTRATNANEPVMSAQTAYAWGAQAETTPFASSYIPTTTATVTRSADVATVATPSALTVGGNLRLGATFKTETGSDFTYYNSAGNVLLDLATGEPNRTSLYFIGSNSVGVFNENAAGAHQYQSQASNPAGNSGNFTTFGNYQTGPRTYVNGVAGIAVSGSGTGPAALPSTIYIGSNYVGSGQVNGWFSNIVVDNK